MSGIGHPCFRCGGTITQAFFLLCDKCTAEASRTPVAQSFAVARIGNPSPSPACPDVPATLGEPTDTTGEPGASS